VKVFQDNDIAESVKAAQLLLKKLVPGGRFSSTIFYKGLLSLLSPSSRCRKCHWKGPEDRLVATNTGFFTGSLFRRQKEKGGWNKSFFNRVFC
jgi:hypothetical protein